jgi:hypothetical protein
MAKGNAHVVINDKRLQQIIRTHPKLADDAIGALAFEGERYIKQGFNTSPPGHTYQLYDPRRTHTASQEGFPPNVDTGLLRNSITARRQGLLHWDISTDKDYAPHLEFGTETMGARPFMEPAARWLEGQVKRVFDTFLQL